MFIRIFLFPHRVLRTTSKLLLFRMISPLATAHLYPCLLPLYPARAGVTPQNFQHVDAAATTFILPSAVCTVSPLQPHVLRLLLGRCVHQRARKASANTARRFVRQLQCDGEMSSCCCLISAASALPLDNLFRCNIVPTLLQVFDVTRC